MGGNSFGTLFRMTTWGESHGEALGVVIDGCPPRMDLSDEDIQKEMDRRRPGQGPGMSPRREKDRVKILSGVFEGLTTGTPLSILLWNEDVDSKAYDHIRHIYRPGHADFTYQAKYGIRDHRGGGRASARETVGRVAAGAVAKKILEKEKISIVAYTIELSGIRTEEMDEGEIERNILRCPDRDAVIAMEERIEEVKRRGDTLHPVSLQIEGRHDVSAIPRINIVCEAMVALVLVDHLLRQRSSHCLLSPAGERDGVRGERQ